jgi:hypothetical protein
MTIMMITQLNEVKLMLQLEDLILQILEVQCIILWASNQLEVRMESG